MQNFLHRRDRLAAVAVFSFVIAGCNTTSDSGPVAAQPNSAAAHAPAAPAGVYVGGRSTSYPPGVGPFGAVRAPSAPAGQVSTPTWQRSDVSERRSVSPDGRTTTTETTRTSVSFDANRTIEALGQLAATSGGGEGRFYDSLAGEWRLQTASSRAICTVMLYGESGASAGAASSNGCLFGGPMHGITGWRYEPGRLVILKGADVALRMNQLGPNRFDGTVTWGILSDTLALYR